MTQPRRLRSTAQNLAPRAPISEPALCVVFMTSAYPVMKLDESEAEMIARAAQEVLDVTAAAVMASPAGRYLGQGERDESIFEIHLRQRFASAARLNRKPEVLHVSAAGPARPQRLPLSKKAPRLAKG